MRDQGSPTRDPHAVFHAALDVDVATDERTARLGRIGHRMAPSARAPSMLISTSDTQRSTVPQEHDARLAGARVDRAGRDRRAVAGAGNARSRRRSGRRRCSLWRRSASRLSSARRPRRRRSRSHRRHPRGRPPRHQRCRPVRFRAGTADLHRPVAPSPRDVRSQSGSGPGQCWSGMHSTTVVYDEPALR